MSLLVVDCCPRAEESATRALYRRYLARRGGEYTLLELYREPLAPLGARDVLRRAALVKAGALNDESLRYARQFQSAREILIAAPYWDLSFPSMLKVYLENVCVSGVTFAYEGARPVGRCRAEEILYFSTCGGDLNGYHAGADYVARLAGMLGIPRLRECHVEGLDIDPALREARLEAGIERALEAF